MLRLSRVDLVLLMMVLFWGGNITILKIALRTFEPLVFNCLRFLTASLAILILYRDVLRDKLAKKELLALLILGILGNTIYQFLFIFGVKYTYVAHSSILLGVTPIFTASISSLLGLEKVRKILWLGILLSFSGIVLIVFGARDAAGQQFQANIGDLFILLASLVWSIYTAFSKSLISDYSSRHYVLYTVVFGTIFIVPFSIPYFSQQDWTQLGAFEWGAVFYSALLALVYGYSAWYYGVQKLGSTRTSVYSNLTPVAGLVIGMIFLGERLALLQWFGALMIFCGLIVNRLSLTQREAAKPVPLHFSE